MILGNDLRTLKSQAALNLPSCALTIYRHITLLSMSKSKQMTAYYFHEYFAISATSHKLSIRIFTYSSTLIDFWVVHIVMRDKLLSDRTRLDSSLLLYLWRFRPRYETNCPNFCVDGGRGEPPTRERHHPPRSGSAKLRLVSKVARLCHFNWLWARTDGTNFAIFISYCVVDMLWNCFFT